MALESVVRSLATTISNYIKGAADAVTRKRMYLAMVREKGKLTFKHSGLNTDWGIEYAEDDLNPYTGNLTFEPVNTWIRAILGWGGYDMTDLITKRERLMNGGSKTQLIKVYTDMGERLEARVMRKFPGRLILADPTVAGHEGEITGLDTIFSISAATAGDTRVGLNNGEYAGLSTAPAAYGGSWDQSGGNDIWPLGDGSTSYDFHRPLTVLYDATGFNGATNTWESNAETAIRFGLTHTNGRNNGMDSQVEVVALWRDGFRIFKDIQTAKERINVTGQTTLYRLGFKDEFNFDGVSVVPEYDVPNAVGYGIPFGQVELMSMQPELLDVYSDFHHDTHSHRFSADFHGQQKFKTIRNFFKLMATP